MTPPSGRRWPCGPRSWPTAGHDLPRAAALARRALEAVPGYAPAAHLLERLLPALERWEEMAKVVEVTAAPTSLGDGGTSVGAEAAVRLERLGALYEDRLGRSRQGAGALRRVGGAGDAPGRGAGRAAAGRREGRRRAGGGRSGATPGDGDPGVRQGDAVRRVFRAGTIFEERAAADDEAVRADEAALALAPVRGRCWWARRGASPARSVRRAGRCAVEQAADEPNPTSASSFEVEAARLFALRLGRPGRRAGGDGPRADVRSGERRGHRRARPAAGSAWGAPTSWSRSWGTLGQTLSTPSTRLPRIAPRPRSSSGSSGAGARRWPPSSGRSGPARIRAPPSRKTACGASSVARRAERRST